MRRVASMLAMAAASFTTGASAVEGLGLSFSGFGTAGAVKTDTDDAQFRSDLRQSHGADRTPDFGVDSRLGLQANLQVDETFSAVGQLLAHRRSGSELPRVEWLFAQAHVNPWLDLRAGRMVLPIFLVSDSLNVGYASHWARAPLEVYMLYPTSSFDGGQAQVRAAWAGTDFTLQGSVGRAHADAYFPNGSARFNLREIYSLNLVAERGSWTFRLGDTEAHSDAIPLLAAEATVDSFRGIGLAYDDGRTLVQGEYVMRRQSNASFGMDSYYVSGGQRFGPWMPYATYSHYQPRSPNPQLGKATRTIAVGLRWDVVTDVAVKAQVESTQSVANFVNPMANFSPDRKVMVFTLLVDFVF